MEYDDKGKIAPQQTLNMLKKEDMDEPLFTANLHRSTMVYLQAQLSQRPIICSLAC